MTNNLIPTSHELLLASKSPRRQDLLKAAGIDFRLIDVDVEETYPEEMEVSMVPGFLAEKKAYAALSLIDQNQIILAADSVVIMNNEIYGKAPGRTKAMQMISALSGKQHLVITGVCLCSIDKSMVFSEHTFVWIDNLTQEEVEYYIDTHKPYDKAGAYGIQDWIGWAKVSRIEGSYANVMGLPVHRVYEELLKW